MNPNTLTRPETRPHTSLTTGPSFPLPPTDVGQNPLPEFSGPEVISGVFGESTAAMAAAVPRNPTRREEEMQLLRQAGHLARSAYIDFAAIRYAMTIGSILVLGTALLMATPRWEPFILGGLVTLPFLFWLIPASIVERQALARQDEIARGVPDFMSLIKLYVQQGLDVPSAFASAGQDLKDAYPSIATEAAIVTAEAKVFGFADALRHFQDRLEVSEVNTLASMLIQSSELGTGVCESLGKNAQTLRQLRAEKRTRLARETPRRIIVPLLFFLVPAAVFIFYAPAIVAHLSELDRAIIESNFGR